MFDNLGKGVMSLAGIGGGLILLYLLVAHGDATIGILKAGGNFVTTETTALQGR